MHGNVMSCHQFQQMTRYRRHSKSQRMQAEQATNVGLGHKKAL